jgi:hypothetical protein
MHISTRVRHFNVVWVLDLWGSLHFRVIYRKQLYFSKESRVSYLELTKIGGLVNWMGPWF